MSNRPGTRHSKGKTASSGDKLPAARSSKEDRLTIGKVAKIVGVSTSTLRLWENFGLVKPDRSEGGFRLYRPETLAMLKRIKHLRTVEHLNIFGIKRSLGREVESASPPQKSLGPNLELMRHRHGLSLTAAAKRAGMTAGYLSAIEKSQAKAPYRAIQKLAKVYGTSILGLYHLPEKTSHVVRSGDRKLMSVFPGFQLELLSVGARSMDSMIFRIEPAAGCNQSYAHEGEEFVYVLEGKFVIWLDDLEKYVLAAGESIWYDSKRNHRWLNPSKKNKAVVLWVVVFPNN